MTDHQTRAPVRQRAPRWARRLGWLVLLWSGGVLALFTVASLLRLLMRAAGMH